MLHESQNALIIGKKFIKQNYLTKIETGWVKE